MVLLNGLLRKISHICHLIITYQKSGSEIARKATNGYTQAVDMWSLGCLITALFIGSSIFAIDGEENFRHPTSAVIAAAVQCDLSILDNIPAWRDVDPHAKDLTTTLINLDEEKRTTAEKALGHEWFRSGHRDINGFYKAVKSSWEPIIPDDYYFEEDLRVFIQAGISKDDVKYPLNGSSQDNY